MAISWFLLKFSPEDLAAGLQPLVLREAQYTIWQGRVLCQRCILLDVPVILYARRQGRPDGLPGARRGDLCAINQCVGSDANMNQGTVKFDFCTGRGRVLQGHQARGDARHAQRVEEPALRLDRRQCQRSEHLRDIPRRASVPRVGARRPRIASTASRRWREHRVASVVSTRAVAMAPTKPAHRLYRRNLVLDVD